MILDKHPFITQRPGPVVLCILDGVGYSDHTEGDAYKAAHTPNLDWLHTNCQNRPLNAHGTHVGLPSDADMGNSEVGHNAIGGGRIVAQGAKLVNTALSTGALFEGEIWRKLSGNVREKSSTLHFIGLFSDGGVHSHLDHLKAMVEQARKEGIKSIRFHILLDGRDVSETSALDYVLPFEDYLTSLNAEGVSAKIASGGGRMTITMDRYGAEWDMVERGWNTHVHGEGRQFASAEEAIKTFREEDGFIDQYLPAFVVAENGQPVGRICSGDSVIFYNFRGDRSIEISQAFEDDEFPNFDRGDRPDVEYSGMMEYDGDDHIPKQYLVAPPAIDQPMCEFLSANGVGQLAISETQKYGHVTFFFNGNRSGKFDDKVEDFIEIPSDVGGYDLRPWMKAVEITDYLVPAICENRQPFVRVNYANGDMVGHTGNFNAARMAVEVVDVQVGRLMAAVKKANGVLLVTSDHGNCDEMFEFDKKGEVKRGENGKAKAKTSHTLNKVPFIVYDPASRNEFSLSEVQDAGLSHIAGTVFNLLGFQAPDVFNRTLLEKK
ncbi:phosphoglyceromutase [Lentisphaera araneosa HTCC2155]|uniref:2,3-bisphosphoglycerate-independent phosphoglycerate mutase n=1 Tax=Lentisphaera araneosa HTCC2155 TaxID=313628 RepID=A6DPX3_9BACT|nr:2,3-bisphosphoglycerate-independent phosphoglycerate mutase [Lentisphaera araneosa]EDM26214.1 phosphoglyceromutase [Lentisphaera araneosa HTCC2155]